MRTPTSRRASAFPFPVRGPIPSSMETHPSGQEVSPMSSSIFETRPRRLVAAAIVAFAIAATAIPAPSQAQEEKPMSAEASDPVKLGWMIGSPPPADKIIRFSDPDYFSFPKLRWTVCHFRQLMPTVGVSRGLDAPIPFERKLDDTIDAVTFTPLGGGAPMTWAQSLSANYTDGIVVVHDGVIVYERYA